MEKQTKSINYREKMTDEWILPFLVDNRTKTKVDRSPLQLMNELGYPQRYIQGRNSDHSVYDCHLTLRFMSIAAAQYGATLWKEDLAQIRKELLTPELVLAEAIEKAQRRLSKRIPDSAKEMLEIDVEIMSQTSVDFWQYFYTADNYTKTAFKRERDRRLFLMAMKQLMLIHIAIDQCTKAMHQLLDFEVKDIHDKILNLMEYMNKTRPKGQETISKIFYKLLTLSETTIKIYQNKMNREIWTAIIEEVRLTYPEQVKKWLEEEKEEERQAQALIRKETKRRRKEAKKAVENTPEPTELTQGDIDRLKNKFEGSLTKNQKQ